MKQRVKHSWCVLHAIPLNKAFVMQLVFFGLFVCLDVYCAGKQNKDQPVMAISHRT